MQVSEIGVTYDFNTDATFKNITHEHLGEKTISGGNYIVRNDTLILNYKKLNNNINSSAEIIKKKKIDSQTVLFANLQVYNSNGKPQGGVHLILQTKEKNNIMAFSSDEEGKFPYLTITDEYIQYLSFSFIAQRELSISTDTLFGSETKIKIMLEDSTLTYRNDERIVKYLIQKTTLNKLELIPLNRMNGNRGELIRLEKM